MRAVKLSGYVYRQINCVNGTALASRSGIASAKLPPCRSMLEPALNILLACWQLRMSRCLRWCEAIALTQASQKSADGFSVIPTVRSPCTLEWPVVGRYPHQACQCYLSSTADYQLLYILGTMFVLSDPHSVTIMVRSAAAYASASSAICV